MKASKEHKLIASFLRKPFLSEEEGGLRTAPLAISDLFLHADPSTGELILYDDADHLLNRITIYSWIMEGVFQATEEMKQVIVEVLHELDDEGFFDESSFIHPVSILLVDENFSVLEELYLVDDELIMVDDDLLKGVDEDLDEFLQKLLSDIE